MSNDTNHLRFLVLFCSFTMVFAFVGFSGAQTVTSITIEPVDPHIDVGDFIQFWAIGTLSDGSTRVLNPIQPPIAASEWSHTCAVLTNGSVKCWGYNYSGELGAGAPPLEAPWAAYEPISVSEISDATAVATGERHSCAVLSDGTVKCWGQNAYGQLGNGSTATAYTPVSVNGVSDAIAIAGGKLHTCALLSNGTIQCWGYNYAGQLGVDRAGPEICSQSACSTTPVNVAGVSNATTIAAGDEHSCALLPDGTVKCWGWNFYGQSGNGDGIQYHTSPVTVSGITTAIAIDADGHHTCALLADGTVKCWGANFYGDLGDGTTNTAYTPVTVSGISTATGIDSGRDFGCALLADGSVRCWGSGDYGSLGNGSYDDSLVPVAVSDINNAVAITAGALHACALLSDGVAKCWGYNLYGALGDGTGIQSNVPVEVYGLRIRWNVGWFGGTADIAIGGSHVCTRLSDGTVRCWGDNGSGQLGNGDATGPEMCDPSLDNPCSTVPVGVSGISAAVDVAPTCAALSNGTVRCWGNNDDGQLGNGTTVGSSSPVTVNGINSALKVASSGAHACAVLSNGTVKCWGDNFRGQLGTDPGAGPEYCGSYPGLPCSTTPVSVNGIDTATDIAAGIAYTCALLSNGSVKCWGYNVQGELGDGTTTTSFIPVSVSGIGDAVSIAAGSFHTCALLSNGDVRCWGENSNGQLGTDNAGPESCDANPSVSCSRTPINVTGISNAIAVAAGGNHTCVLLSGGAVRCWGNNLAGELGNGTTTDSSVPVSVNGINNAVAIAAGGSNTCAVLSDGTVRCWGANAFSGTLGIGTIEGPEICTNPNFDPPLQFSCSTNPVQVIMGAAGSILWSSSRPQVATINDRGVATGIDDGVSIITATLGQLSGSTTLTVGTVFTLTVTKQGTGNGTVISFNLPGINCGIDCLEAYGVSTGVTLQANEDNGSLFAGWTGDPDCTDGIVTMNANKTCTATFDLDVHTITITRDGTGTGTVLIGGPGGPVVCGNDCQATYPTGTGIILDVLPGADSEFAGWSGDPDCADAHVLMDADKTCTATFNLQSHRLIIGKPGNGSGTVTSVNVPGINCGNDCSEPYPVGTRATLQAVPDQWNDFAWGGDPDCNDGEVTIGNADVTCFAVFNIQTFTMTVTKAGNGRGVVITNEQGGINCGLDCPSADKTYNGGTEVTLTAATDVPWLFAGWSGDPDCADGLVTMNANKTCTAEFNRQVFRLNIQRDAESVVSSEDGRIDCGIDCDETYDGGTEVRLTVDTTVQSRGQGLVILSGDPGCSNGVMEIGQVIFFNVTVTMDTDKTCIATFHSFEELQFNQMLMLRNESQKTPEFRIENGIPRFISMRVPIPAALPDDPVIQALDFLDRYKYLYRIKEPKGDLYLERIKTNRFNAIGGGPPDPSDRAQHLFFGQLANGILVHGASLAVHMRGNMITSTSGKYLTKIPAVTLPAVQAPAAEAIALGSVQGNDKKVIGVTKLFYYNRGLTAIGGGTPDPSNTPTRLAWRVMVRGLRSSDGAGTSWRLFIDAKDGAVLSKIDEMREGEPDKDFDIQSASNTESNNCWARTDVAGIADWFNENGQTGNYPGPAGDLYSDGQNAYDFAHLTYDFYHTNFGRHSWYDIDDFWGAEEAEVDVWVHVGNNWNNASYRPDCDHLTFGEGYMANDTFVHEYTHAVTRWSSNLEYENQSGALNESYSDVMAALLDGDWLEGEDNPTRGEDGDRGATLGGNLVGDGNREKGDECDNNIDDDGDGFINEGCPETGNQCGNGVDDDGDGFIDEGCPETGNQCGNLVDDDGDGFIDEGCPGSCQDGIDNGLTGEADSADTDCFTRDLANPARKSDPDHRIGSMSGDGIGLRILGLNEAVNCDRNDPNFNDCGYVHTNSGIPNKAAYLLTVGGVHTGSGVEVRGIGPEKVMRLYYDVLTSRLHSNSQFYDARDATIEQAQEYVDNNEYEFVQADVCSVMNAFAAVGYGDSDIDCDGVLDRDTTDNDGDSIIDGDDNCPQAANPGQDDMNGNGIGDRCDPDKDGDGVDDIFDNCPTVANANQADADPNTPEGDACEDHDGDGLFDTADNCPNDFNPDQADRYGTTLGDACETDNDNDGIENESDNCPSTPNPGQADWDGDGVGDACDNCVRAANLNQRDMDRDGEGNACDDDIDGDGIPNADDQCPENALPIIILGGSEVLPCRSNEDLAALLSGNYGDFVNGMMFFPSLSDSMKLPIFPCIDDGCPDWIAENYQTEVYMSLPVNFQARIIDDKGFAVRKGITGMQQTLRFHPAADSFFRFQSVSAGGALSEVSPQGLTQLTAYKGRNYFLEIYPAADVVAGQQYPFTIRVKSYQATSNISVSPTFSDFGNINVGSTTTQTFTVNNTGSADLLISQISILPPGDFSKGLDNCSGRSLLPEEGCTVRVHFSPTLATVRVATLSIPSNAPDTPILNVALNGMGTSASVFNDAPEGSFAENFINTLFYSGITGGCGGGKFCPNDPITRGQMAVFIESSLGNPPNTCTGQFTDVPIGHPFCGFIERLAADGVTGGCGEGKYCPDDPVTRGQMAVFIEAAMGNSASGCGGQFADVPIGHPFCGFIEKLASDGITGGCGDGNFCPDNPVTRAQMAVFLVAAPAPLFP